MKLLLLLAILLILIALAKTSPSINKYRIIYPYKQFQIFDNQIYILIHVPENLQAANKNQICINLNNATEKLLVRQRTLLSKCLNPPNTYGNGAATLHLSFNIPFQSNNNKNLLLSLSITNNKPFQPANAPYRLESEIHDSKIIAILSKKDTQRNRIHQKHEYKILYPKNGMTLEINNEKYNNNIIDVYIYVNNPSTNGIICLTLNHQHDNKLCVPHDVAQPIQFTRDALNKNNLTNQLHVLKVEKVIHNNIIDLQQKNIPSKNLKLIDTIVFMTHHVNTALPNLEIISPKNSEAITIENVENSVVYFKFLLTGIKGIMPNAQVGDQNGFLLCFQVRKDDGSVDFKSCNGITNEPLKLTGLDIGTYTVSAHLSNMFESEIKNTKTSEIIFFVQKETNSVLSQQVEISNDGSSIDAPYKNQLVNNKSCGISSFNIHIFAFRRSLNILLQSLSNAYYNYCAIKIEINVIVFIDINPNDDVGDDQLKATTGTIIQEIQQFQTTWQYGNVKYIVAKEHLGLVNNIMQSFNIYDENNDNDDDLHTRVLLLEDDVLVSKFFMYYILRVDSYVIEQSTRSNITAVIGNNIMGISLYRPLWNDIKWCRIDHATRSNDNNIYLMQLPSSWGAMYYIKQWKQYIEWYKKIEKFDNPFFIPESMSNTWKTSWKLPLLYYMLINEKYVIYPGTTSFSTTLAPIGENIKDPSLKYLFSVPIAGNEDENAVKMLNKFQDDQSFKPFKDLPRYNIYHDLINANDLKFNGNVMNYFKKQDNLNEDIHNLIHSTARCEEHIESMICDFSNVGFSIPSKKTSGSNNDYEIIMFDNYHPVETRSSISSILFPNTYRHRCCMEEVPSNIAIKHVPGSYQFVKNDATVKNSFNMCSNTFHGDTFMFSMVNFPQHGHTLHDTLLSLFVTIYEHRHRHQQYNNGNSDREIRFIISNLNDENLKSVDDLIHYKPFLIKLLNTFNNNENNVNDDNIYMLSEIPQQLLCIDHLVYGVSSKMSFYNNLDSFGMKEKYVNPFLTFYRNALHINGVVKKPNEEVEENTIHYIERANRKVLNKNELLHLCTAKYEYNIQILRFEGMTLKKQVEIMEKHVDILMGATGTGLFNVLFMNPKQFAIDDQDQPEQEKQQHLIMLFPFGTFPYMGNNIINMAKFKGIKVHILESKTPYKNEFLGIDTRSNNLLEIPPEKIWDNNWLNGYSIYMNQNFYIEKNELDRVIKEIY